MINGMVHSDALSCLTPDEKKTYVFEEIKLNS